MSDSSVDGSNAEDDIEAIRQQKLEELRRKAESGDIGADSGSAEGESKTPDEPIHFEGGSISEVVESHETVLVDFYADWCGPCKMLEPTLETIAATTDVAVLKVDADVYGGLAGQYGVQGLPTLLLFRDGEAVERLVGAQTEHQLRSVIERHQE